MERKEIKVGEMVKIHPANSLFMRGMTHGQIRSVGRKFAQVNRPGTTEVHRVPFADLLPA